MWCRSQDECFGNGLEDIPLGKLEVMGQVRLWMWWRSQDESAHKKELLQVSGGI
jgi:hypothetical protein